MSARYVICTAITERQRDILAEAFAKATWTKRRHYKDHYGVYHRWSEDRKFNITVRKVQHPATSIYGEGTHWEFSVPSQEQRDAGWTLGHYFLLDQFKPGMHIRYLASNGCGTLKGTEGTVVDVYAGDLYIHMDGMPPTPTKSDGTPDLYRTPQIGAYWVEPV